MFAGCFDLPAMEAEFRVSKWDRPGSRARHLRFERALKELEGRLTVLDWSPGRRRDMVCEGRLQHVVRSDGTRWDVTLYCQYEVLSAVLQGRPAPMANDAGQRQAEWGGEGQQSIRLQGPDGFGLLARQRSEPPERG